MQLTARTLVTLAVLLAVAPASAQRGDAERALKHFDNALCWLEHGVLVTETVVQHELEMLIPTLDRLLAAGQVDQVRRLAGNRLGAMFLYCDGSVRHLLAFGFQSVATLERMGADDLAAELDRILIGLLLPAVQKVRDNAWFALEPYITLRG